MYQHLFGIQFLDMFLIMILLGIVSAFVLFYFLSKKLSLDKKTLLFYYIVLTLSVLIGFITAFFVQQLYNYIDHLTNGKKFKLAGFTFFGGLIGGVSAFIVLTLIFAKEKKQHLYKIINTAAPCLVLAHAFGRLGCFCGGCCYGIANETFGIRFRYPRYKVLPTNLYEAIFLFLLFAVMMLLFLKFKKRDIQILIYGFAYSVFRFLIEFLRGDSRGEFLPLFSPSQWQSIFLLIATIVLLVIIKKKQSKTNL